MLPPRRRSLERRDRRLHEFCIGTPPATPTTRSSAASSPGPLQRLAAHRRTRQDRPGTHGFESTLNRKLAAYPNLTVQSRAQFESQLKANVNRLLGLVYVLLALAVVVALIGIVNTLILSVLERTREIGLLRAVGMKRPRVRTMIRSESVIIALVGAVVGVVIGTGLGLALAAALRNNGVTNISVPVIRLILFLTLSATLGRIAAIWPARRAANLDVLTAIAIQ